MKKILITSGINIVLIGCLLFLLFFYKGSQDLQNEDGEATTVGNPEEIVSQNCIACHGDNLQGGSGPPLNRVGLKYQQNEIEDIINNGKGAMPAGVISAEEAKVVAEWLSQKEK
ncbi:c-type cytochrome [Priestia endophytica]|uniref:c-type cytochrome n=1 Tax=Priestia endophytica TaxID=135735 RepID=UPI00203D98D9|nr:cytochrome c [Priestia endophytica]MCM3537983.1 cytochrome c [Priestia endophytica]